MGGGAPAKGIVATGHDAQFDAFCPDRIISVAHIDAGGFEIHCQMRQMGRLAHDLGGGSIQQGVDDNSLQPQFAHREVKLRHGFLGCVHGN